MAFMCKLDTYFSSWEMFNIWLYMQFKCNNGTRLLCIVNAARVGISNMEIVPIFQYKSVIKSLAHCEATRTFTTTFLNVQVNEAKPRARFKLDRASGECYISNPSLSHRTPEFYMALVRNRYLYIKCAKCAMTISTISATPSLFFAPTVPLNKNK